VGQLKYPQIRMLPGPLTYPYAAFSPVSTNSTVKKHKWFDGCCIQLASSLFFSISYRMRTMSLLSRRRVEDSRCTPRARPSFDFDSYKNLIFNYLLDKNRRVGWGGVAPPGGGVFKHQGWWWGKGWSGRSTWQMGVI